MIGKWYARSQTLRKPDPHPYNIVQGDNTMKIKKVLKWTLIVVPLMLIIAVVVLLLCLDGILRQQVQTQATASTKLNTTLGSASISLLGGEVKLGDLKIGSPQGFQAPTMFQLKGVHVAVNYSELSKKPIKITSIVIDNPHLILEQSGGKLNVQAAMDQMPPSGPSTLTMIIGELQVNNTTVTLRPGVPMLPAEIVTVLPSVTLRNIGNGDGNQNGAAIKDVLKLVLDEIVKKANESGKLGTSGLLNINPEDLGRNVKTQADQAVKDAQQKLDAGLKNILGGK